MILELNRAKQLVRALGGELDGETSDLIEDYLRDHVQGSVFDNAVASLKIGTDGFCYQLQGFSATFHASTRVVSGEFISDDEVKQLLWEGMSTYRDCETQMFILYNSDYIRREESLFLGFRPGSDWDDLSAELDDSMFTRYERGQFRLDLPLFARLDVQSPSGVLGLREGTLLLLRTHQNENLLLRLPDYGSPPISSMRC